MRDSHAECFLGHEKHDNTWIRFEAGTCRTQRYETTKSEEHGMETGHHQTSRTATQVVQNCDTSRTGSVETRITRGNRQPIVRKCEIFKQMMREARKHIYQLIKMKNHSKNRNVSNGSAATRSAESRASRSSLF